MARPQIDLGNLLTLPVGGGLLYVQPVYVSSTGETSYPLLREVLVAFGNKVAFEPTLDAALDNCSAATRVRPPVTAARTRRRRRFRSPAGYAG